jgi:hypothetical protein
VSDDRRRELETQLSAYLDGELGLAERRAVEALLETDEEARALLKQLRATVEAVRGLPRARASERLIESLRARMERQSLLEGRPVPGRTADGGRSYRKWMAVAAAIGLVVGAGYLAWPWAQEWIARPGQQYALRLDERQHEHLAEQGLPDRAPGAADEERMAGAPPAAAPVEQPVADAAVDRALARTAPTERRVPMAKPADDKVEAAAEHSDEFTAFFARPSADSTVLEATFADAVSRRAAVTWLREEYAFQPVSPPGQPLETASLEVRVPDVQSARRVVSSLRQTLSADNLRIVSREDAPPLPVVVQQEPAVAALSDASSRSFEMVDSSDGEEKAAMRVDARHKAAFEGRAGVAVRSADDGQGAHGASSAPAASIARRPMRASLPDTAITDAATRSAPALRTEIEQVETEPSLRSPAAAPTSQPFQRLATESRHAPLPYTLWLYIHVEPPATAPADVNPPASPDE